MDNFTPPPAPNLWDRHIMPRLVGCACGMPQIMKQRSKIVPRAHGKVLEFGAGGGINAQFYDPQKVGTVTGIDPSAELINQAGPKLEVAKVPINLVGGIAEALPFDDESFDTILITFTLCSVQDQAQAISEARRVLRADGQLLVLEHGSAPDANVAKWQRRVEPIWKRMAGGCHLTRPIIDAVTAGGFTITERTGQYLPGAPRIAGWVESGVGVKAG